MSRKIIKIVLKVENDRMNNRNDLLIMHGDGRMYENVYIPSRFENIILRHVILNCVKTDNHRPAPLLLIQGKKGEGKSFMTEAILKGNGIYHKIISSSILAGEKENDAVRRLMQYYNKCEMNETAGKYSALVIDDFHLSIAVTKQEASHTTNADNLLSALMNIADRKDELKTPIILLGNNFTNMYAPLTRFGRMSIVTWTPSPIDKAEIVKQLIIRHDYDRRRITFRDIQTFVEHYDQYIGFYEQVVENTVLNDFEEVTQYFVSQGGKVAYSVLHDLIQKSTTGNIITMDSLYREAEKLMNMKLEKLDT